MEKQAKRKSGAKELISMFFALVFIIVYKDRDVRHQVGGIKLVFYGKPS
jgi:hypothetical protein